MKSYFQYLKNHIVVMFLLKNCENLLQCKNFSLFFSKNGRISCILYLKI